MPDTEVAGTLEIRGASKEDGGQVIRAIRARFEIATSLAEVQFPILIASDRLTKVAFRARVLGQNRAEARRWIETLCRDALVPFNGADPPFCELAKLDIEVLPG